MPYTQRSWPSYHGGKAGCEQKEWAPGLALTAALTPSLWLCISLWFWAEASSQALAEVDTSWANET